MVPREGQFLDDRESLLALIEQMPAAERALYRGYGALTLESAFPNRVMIIYTLKGGTPDSLEVLKFGDIGMTRIGGPTTDIECNRRVVGVGVTPAKWPGRDLFLHVPQQFILKWTGKVTATGVQFVPSYAVLIKSLSREHRQAEGHTYCVTLNRFRERFPKVQIMY